MKRVVAIVIIMAMVTTLFAFSVYAAPSPGASYNASISSDDGNITAYAYAVYEEGVYQMSTSGTEITSPSLLISIRVVNNTDKWIVKDTDQFKLRISGIYAINYPFEFVDIENCTITEVATASGRADLTIKGDNSFILAPNETYVMSFRMVVYDGFTTPVLQFFNNQFLNSAYTIEELASLPADELAYLSSINLYLKDMIDDLTYNGSLSGYVPNYNTQWQYINNYRPSNQSTNFIIRGVRVRNKPVIESSSYYLDPVTDTMKYMEQIHIDVDYYIRFSNFLGYSVYINDASVFAVNLELIGDETSYQADIVSFDSTILNGYQIYRNNNIYRLECTGSYTDDSNHYLIPVGYQYVHYRVRYYLARESGSTLNLTLPTFDLNNILVNYSNYTVTQSEYIPASEQSILFKIWQSLTKPSSTDNTEEAQEMNDEIHDAEQVWYDNNSEALEQVGLSNYRFSPSQSSGITQAVTQFQAVWNALGQWTNVYIFILILSISTYIIRHEPTTRVKQYRSSVQAERAERISYYGKKNAESRAASSGSTFKAALRRRK